MWLKYTDNGTSVARYFKHLTNYDRPETDRMTKRTLRGHDVSHLMSKRTNYEIAIGADELYDPDAREFIDTFWEAERIFVADEEPDTPPLDASYTECTPPGGISPIEFIEGVKELPTITIKISAKKSRL
jgi:hypothetical protein